eukprot:12675720-Alexandrium_andersonii.AAC.1
MSGPSSPEGAAAEAESSKSREWMPSMSVVSGPTRAASLGKARTALSAMLEEPVMAARRA